jgi:hypothetical protein
VMGECVIVTLKVCGGGKGLLKGDPGIQEHQEKRPEDQRGRPEHQVAPLPVHQSVLDFPIPWSHVRSVDLVQECMNDRRHSDNNTNQRTVKK